MPYSLFLYVSLCVYVCVSLSICICVCCVCVCVCVCAPECRVWKWISVSLAGQQAPSDPPVSTPQTLGLQAWFSTHVFFPGFWVLNSSSHTCKANILLPELSSQPFRSCRFVIWFCSLRTNLILTNWKAETDMFGLQVSHCRHEYIQADWRPGNTSMWICGMLHGNFCSWKLVPRHIMSSIQEVQCTS